jgi:hypothetical protein
MQHTVFIDYIMAFLNAAVSYVSPIVRAEALKLNQTAVLTGIKHGQLRCKTRIHPNI